MSKQLKFTYEDKEYTLEFTRKSVAEMERKGFLAGELLDKPMTMLPALFEGAFLAHHRYVKKDTIEKIFSSLTNKQELVSTLVELYNEPIQALVEDSEDNEGNVNWTTNW